jgi:hypothetical protein
MSAIGPFSIRDALRHELSWTRLAIDRFATRYVANSIVTIHEAVTEDFSVVQTIFVAPRKWARLARQ